MISYLTSYLFDYMTLSLVIILFTSLYYYSTSTYDKWRKSNVPCVPPLPLFGNSFKIFAFLEHQMETFDKIYRQFPDAKVCGLYQMKTPFLMIRDPELINRILITDFSHFTDHGMDLDPAVTVLARSLFFLTGKRWRTTRHKLSPGFTSGKIKDTYDQIKECSQQLVGRIDEQSKLQDPQIEVKAITKDFATDVIGTCAFGLKLDTIKNDNSDFRKYTARLFDGGFAQNIKTFTALLVPKVAKFLKFKLFPRDAIEFFRSVFSDVIAYRTENNVIRNDLTQTLLQAKNESVQLNSNSVDEDKGI